VILLKICQVSPGDTAAVRGARTRSFRRKEGRGDGRTEEITSPTFVPPALTAIPRGPFLRPNYPSLFTKISATKFAPAVKVIDSFYIVIELLGHQVINSDLVIELVIAWGVFRRFLKLSFSNASGGRLNVFTSIVEEDSNVVFFIILEALS